MVKHRSFTTGSLKMFKLIVALAFVALCSARTLGYDNYFVNIVDDNIVITGKEGRQVDILTKYLPGQYGQQYVKVFVNGPDFPAKTVQYSDYQVNSGVYQTDILYQIFKKYQGYLDQQVYLELLNVIEKYVQIGEIHPVVYQSLQYLYYQNQDYLKDQLFYGSGILGQDYSYQSQVPYGKLGSYYGSGSYPSYYNKYFNQYYGQNYYQTPYNKLGYYGNYQQYPYQYGGSSYNRYPSTYQYGGYYGPYSGSYYGSKYGYGYQQYPSTYQYGPFSDSYYGSGYQQYPSAYQYGPYSDSYYGSGYQQYPQQWYNLKYGGYGNQGSLYNTYNQNQGISQWLNSVVPSGQYSYPYYQSSYLNY